MTQPCSNDLRERAMARVAAGELIRAIAAALVISPSSVSKWSRRLRETGSVSPAKIGGISRVCSRAPTPTGSGCECASLSRCAAW